MENNALSTKFTLETAVAEICRGIWMNSESTTRYPVEMRPPTRRRRSNPVSTLWLSDAVTGLLYVPFPGHLREALLFLAADPNFPGRVNLQTLHDRLRPHAGSVHAGFRLDYSLRKRWRVEKV